MNSVIAGGVGNIITGSCNAILGGSGNNDNGFNFVGIFGNGVGALMDHAFHANEFVARNMKQPGGGALPCELYFQNPGTGFCPVFILP